MMMEIFHSNTESDVVKLYDVSLTYNQSITALSMVREF